MKRSLTLRRWSRLFNAVWWHNNNNINITQWTHWINKLDDSYIQYIYIDLYIDLYIFIDLYIYRYIHTQIHNKHTHPAPLAHTHPPPTSPPTSPPTLHPHLHPHLHSHLHPHLYPHLHPRPTPPLTSPLLPAAACRWRSPSQASAWCVAAARTRSCCAACPAGAGTARPPAGSARPAAAPSPARTCGPSPPGSPPERWPAGDMEAVLVCRQAWGQWKVVSCIYSLIVAFNWWYSVLSLKNMLIKQIHIIVNVLWGIL